MSVFLKSSIGKKLLMSLSGLFLIIFLLVHLVANLFLLAGADAYNVATHFMDTNPVIQIMQPLLAIGFLVHIIYGIVIELQNRRATPVKYKVVNQKDSSTWASRNMIWLGLFVFAFLVLHIGNFFVKMKFGTMDNITIDGVVMHDSYALVSNFFNCTILSVVYIIAIIALGLHLHHAFWSAFQTLGLSNNIWRVRLSVIGDIYAVIITVGFVIIPLYFMFFG